MSFHVSIFWRVPNFFVLLQCFKYLGDGTIFIFFIELAQSLHYGIIVDAVIWYFVWKDLNL